jgi:HSP20 family protein
MANNLSRWTPSQQLAAAREPLFRLFDTFFTDAAGEDLGTRTWTPPVDIQETDEAYRLQAELPGMSKDNIQITIENNVLRLSGERKWEKDVKKESYHRVERVYGSFSRSFALPHQVSPEKVEAKFDNGVLSVVVPKADTAKPRHISIS